MDGALLGMLAAANGIALAEGAWDAEGPGLWHHLGTWSPWILAAAFVVLVGRAVARRSRYRAVDLLDAAACARVHDAIRRAELRTVGEIVPVVVERSDAHPGACWLAAVTTLLLGTALALPLLPFDQPAYLLACQAALGAAGWIVTRLLPDLQRLFVRESRADEVVAEQALLEFHGLGLHRTAEATGVLIFVSLLERRVVVLGDSGIDAHMGPEAWSTITAELLQAIAGGRLADGLATAVESVGEALAVHFPWREGDRNELPDRLVVRRE